jgi:ankyrin repeat protein
LFHSRGGDVNQKCDGGKTPLMISSEEGNIEVVKELLKNGADVDMLDDNGVSVVSLAAEFNHLSILKVICD